MEFDIDEPWEGFKKRMWQGIRERKHLKQSDAFVLGASVLTQVFMEFLQGNYSQDKRRLSGLAESRRHGDHRDRWFEASGVNAEREFFYLTQEPRGDGWCISLGLWHNATAFDEDTYRDKCYVLMLSAWSYAPSFHTGQGDERYWSMIDVKIFETGALYSGTVRPATGTWLKILNRAHEIIQNPELIDYLPYRTLGWYEWAL